MKAVSYAQEFTRKRYAVWPCAGHVVDGQKRLAFRSPGWKQGKYPEQLEDIPAHWGNWSGIAVHTGRSGIAVVDIDVHGAIDGFASLEAAGIELPDTFAVRTQSGGRHLYYRNRTADGKPVVTSSTSAIAVGVDVKAGNAIVLAPPTAIEGGGEYVHDDPIPYVGTLPWFPDGLLRDTAPVPPPPAGVPGWKAEGRRAKAARDLLLACADVASAAEGTRNKTLNAKSWRFGRLIAEGLIDAHLVRDRLGAAGLACGLPDWQVAQIITGAIDAAAQKPG